MPIELRKAADGGIDVVFSDCGLATDPLIVNFPVYDVDDDAPASIRQPDRANEGKAATD